MRFVHDGIIYSFFCREEEKASLEERTLLHLKKINTGIFGAISLVKLGSDKGFSLLELMKYYLNELQKEEISLDSIRILLGVSEEELVKPYNQIIEELIEDNPSFDKIGNIWRSHKDYLSRLYEGFQEGVIESYRIIGREDLADKYKENHEGNIVILTSRLDAFD